MRFHQNFHRVVLILLTLMVMAARPAYAQETLGLDGQTLTMSPGDSASRKFGDLLVKYHLGDTGETMTCILYLSTQLVGIRTLVTDSFSFNFNTQLGLSMANGSIQMELRPGNQVSTLSGNFSYTTAGGKDPFVFKGDLIGWYVKEEN